MMFGMELLLDLNLRSASGAIIRVLIMRFNGSHAVAAVPGQITVDAAKFVSV
jgi:hypothetical protein